MFTMLQLWSNWLCLQHLQNLSSGLVSSVWPSNKFRQPHLASELCFPLRYYRMKKLQVWSHVCGCKAKRWRRSKISLPGILHVPNREMQIIWFCGRREGKLLGLLFSFFPLLSLKSSDNFDERERKKKKFSYCVSSVWDQRSSLENCYTPGWCAGLWWAGEGSNDGEILAEGT